MEKLLVSEEGIATLFGSFDRNLKSIEEAYQVSISARGANIFLKGDSGQVAKVENLLRQLSGLVQEGHPLKQADFEASVQLLQRDPGASLRDLLIDSPLRPTLKKVVHPKSPNQKRYLESIQSNDMVFGIGPAGTGKTYLAMAMAVAHLNGNRVSRIVLTRPAVEAGERLGYLPGTLLEKIDPYLRPLYDALNDLMEIDRAHKLLDRGVIEIAPLAYMRGRTLNDSFLILDEAQNTTSEQMKMFLTRLGFNSKAVITGDITQVDLPRGRRSGLVEARDLMGDIEGIGFIHFNESDVVRHSLVQKIILAYEAGTVHTLAAAAAGRKPRSSINARRRRSRPAAHRPSPYGHDPDNG
jgi:phosphate starvation-inducible PhoH-like protein